MASKLTKIFFCGVALLLAAGGNHVLAAIDGIRADPGGASDTSAVSAPNYGEEFTRPLARFDLRLKYRSKADGSNLLRNTYRLDYPFRLRSGWQIVTRTDLPVAANDTEGADNRKGVWKMGLGDILTQLGLVSPEASRFRYGAGLRVIWPSETKPQLGSETYQLAPIAGFSYAPTFLSDGSFVQFIWREPFSVGGPAGAKRIHRSVLNPGVSVALPYQLYATSSPDIMINWTDHGRWFVPFNLSVGKRFGPKIITSLEWNQALVKQYRAYDWDLEARIGYFF